MPRRSRPLANAPSRARTREGHHAAHARRTTAQHRLALQRHGARVSREDLERFDQLQAELQFAQTKIAALNFEIARLKRWRFGQSSESLDAQSPLFDAIVADTAIEDAAARQEQQQAPEGSRLGPPPRAPSPARGAATHRAPPRTDRHDVRVRAAPGAHRRGRQRAARLRAGACSSCRAPCPRQVRLPLLPDASAHAALPARIIDKGIPAAGPARAGGGGQARRITCRCTDRKRSTPARACTSRARRMAQWVGSCGVRLAPLAEALQASSSSAHSVHPRRRDAGGAAGAGQRQDAPRLRVGVPHDGRSWPSAACGSTSAASRGRGGEHPRRVLKDYSGTLVTDDYAGYNAIHARQDIIEAGCMAHARRKLFEAHELTRQHDRAVTPWR